MTAKNKLGLFDFTMIVVSLVIGMGIFRTPANVAAASPTPAIFFISWFSGGLVALFGALTYAGIGSRLPVKGGYYKVFRYSYFTSIFFGFYFLILLYIVVFVIVSFMSLIHLLFSELIASF